MTGKEEVVLSQAQSPPPCSIQAVGKEGHLQGHPQGTQGTSRVPSAFSSWHFLWSLFFPFRIQRNDHRVPLSLLLLKGFSASCPSTLQPPKAGLNHLCLFMASALWVLAVGYIVQNPLFTLSLSEGEWHLCGRACKHQARHEIVNGICSFPSEHPSCWCFEVSVIGNFLSLSCWLYLWAGLVSTGYYSVDRRLERQITRSCAPPPIISWLLMKPCI